MFMNKIKIITDSNSGLKQHEGEKLGVFVIPMPFFVDGKEYLEELTLSQEEFYPLLAKGANISTSQPSAFYLTELFEKTLQDYEEIIYIPMSSGLSGTCANAKVIAEQFHGRIHVIDNHRISVTQKESVLEAVYLYQQGKTAAEIEEYLLKTAYVSSIYIYLDTLEYLKKGGRITPAAALLSNLLKIKPILTTRGDKFDKFNVCRNLIKARKLMIQQAKKDVENDFKEYYEKGLMAVSVAHTENFEEAEIFKKEIQEALPKLKFHFVDPLSLSVSCHIGPGALAIALSVDIREDSHD